MGKAKGGRPVGTVLTPRKLLEQDMKDAARLNAKMREAIQGLMTALEREAQVAEDTDVRLKILETLGKVTALQSGMIERGTKLLLGDVEGGGDSFAGAATPATPAGAKTSEDLLKELRGRK